MLTSIFKTRLSNVGAIDNNGNIKIDNEKNNNDNDNNHSKKFKKNWLS